MNCVWFETRLDDLLDERLPVDGDAELNEHAAICPQCARLLADHQALLESIELFVLPDARGALAARVVAEMAIEPASMATPSRRATSAAPVASVRRAAIWISAAVAAAVLVGVSIMEWGGAHRTPTVADSKAPGLDVPKMVVQQPVRNAAIGNIAADNHDLLASQSVAELESFANLIGPQQRTLMEQMTDGLKPVTHSMSAALKALRRTLPGSGQVASG